MLLDADVDPAVRCDDPAERVVSFSVFRQTPTRQFSNCLEGSPIDVPLLI